MAFCHAELPYDGWHGRIRTCIDPGNNRGTCRLAHMPTTHLGIPVGFEPTTSGLGNQRAVRCATGSRFPHLRATPTAQRRWRHRAKYFARFFMTNQHADCFTFGHRALPSFWLPRVDSNHRRPGQSRASWPLNDRATNLPAGGIRTPTWPLMVRGLVSRAVSRILWNAGQDLHLYARG